MWYRNSKLVGAEGVAVNGDVEQMSVMSKWTMFPSSERHARALAPSAPWCDPFIDRNIRFEAKKASLEWAINHPIGTLINERTQNEGEAERHGKRMTNCKPRRRLEQTLPSHCSDGTNSVFLQLGHLAPKILSLNLLFGYCVKVALANRMLAQILSYMVEDPTLERTEDWWTEDSPPSLWDH